MLDQYWATLYDAGQTLDQYWVAVSCLLYFAIRTNHPTQCPSKFPVISHQIRTRWSTPARWRSTVSDGGPASRRRWSPRPDLSPSRRPIRTPAPISAESTPASGASWVNLLAFHRACFQSGVVAPNETFIIAVAAVATPFLTRANDRLGATATQLSLRIIDVSD